MSIRKRILIVISPFILIGIFIIVLKFATGGFIKYGPYHRASIIREIDSFFSFDERNFFIYSYNIYEIKNDSVKEVARIGVPIHNAEVYGDYIYCNSLSRGMIVIDKNLNYHSTISQIQTSNSCIYNDKIFYIKAANSKEENRVLYSYDINSEIEMTVCSVNDNLIVEIDENKSILVSLDYKPILINKEEVPFYYCYLNNEYYFWHENTRHIVLQDDEFIMAISDFKDDVVFFATSITINDENCLALKDNYRCICSYGISNVYSYNFLTNELKLLRSYSEGTIPLEIDISCNFKYYFNGGFYNNETLIKEISVIEYGQSYYPRWNTLFLSDLKSRWFLFYYNGEFIASDE